MIQHQSDQQYMEQAMALARRGLYSCHPNPRVGCLIVKNGEVAGQGWHEQTGKAHAEVMALTEAGGQARGATAYVTLEPCSHHGHTAPCCDALIEAGVARVVTAMADPYTEVAGRGLARLKASGAEVQTGVMETEARWLNRGFISRCERGRPWVRIKMAVSLDGRTALQNGESQWITGSAAREDVHHWRARASGILTGSGTLLTDNPSLTARVPEIDATPLRIIADSHWQTPPGAHIFDSPGEILIAGLASNAIPAELADSGARILPLPETGERIDLRALLLELGKLELNELHTECGPVLAGALIEQDLADEFLIYLAPKLMGTDSRGMFVLPGVLEMAQIKKLRWRDMSRVGEDLRIIAEPERE